MRVRIYVYPHPLKRNVYSYYVRTGAGAILFSATSRVEAEQWIADNGHTQAYSPYVSREAISAAFGGN